MEAECPRERRISKSREVKTSLACLMCRKAASMTVALWMRSRAHGHEVHEAGGLADHSLEVRF